MAEHLIVVQAVEGSSPFVHPKIVTGIRPPRAGDFSLGNPKAPGFVLSMRRDQLCDLITVLRRRDWRRQPMTIPYRESGAATSGGDS